MWKLIRVKDWWYHNGVFLLGITFTDTCRVSTFSLLKGFLVVSLYLAYGYGLNEYCDKSYRKYNNVYFFKSFYGIALHLLLAVNLILSFFWVNRLFSFVIIGAVLSWIYSSYPFRLKLKPIFRLFLNGFGFSLLFLMGINITGSLDATSFIMWFYLFLLFIFFELVHDLDDLEQDRQEGIRTLPVIIGIQKTKKIILTSVFILSVSAFILFMFGIFPGLFFVFSIIIYLWVLKLVNVSLPAGVINNNYKGIKKRVRFIFSVYGLGLLILFVFYLS
jgi:4-hydroxybenzoate polyprenyltransferase